MKVTEADRAAAVIKAKTGRTWHSWGEVVEIDLRQVAGAGLEVDVRSKPVFPLTVVDYGKNERNVRLILERLLGTERLPSPSYRRRPCGPDVTAPLAGAFC